MPNIIWTDALVVKPAIDSLGSGCVQLLIRKSSHFVPRYSFVVQGVREDGSFTTWVPIEGEITEAGEVHTTLDVVAPLFAEAKTWVVADRDRDRLAREEQDSLSSEQLPAPRPAPRPAWKTGQPRKAVQREGKTARDRARKMERRKGKDANA